MFTCQYCNEISKNGVKQVLVPTIKRKVTYDYFYRASKPGQEPYFSHSTEGLEIVKEIPIESTCYEKMVVLHQEPTCEIQDKNKRVRIVMRRPRNLNMIHADYVEYQTNEY